MDVSAGTEIAFRWIAHRYPGCGCDVVPLRTEHEWFDERESAPVCYSAIEVGDSANNDDDGGSSKRGAPQSQLRHGLRQLQYAMPAILGSRMRWAASRRPDENYPFFFVPVLVTNAPLILAHADLDVQKVEGAGGLNELGREVPYLIWSAGLGPDFYVHCQRQLRDLHVTASGKCMKEIEARRQASGIPSWLQPSGLAELIKVDGSHIEQIAEFKNIVVTRIGSLPNVVAALRAGFERMAKSLKINQ
jgi:hypothetical protein